MGKQGTVPHEISGVNFPQRKETLRWLRVDRSVGFDKVQSPYRSYSTDSAKETKNKS